MSHQGMGGGVGGQGWFVNAIILGNSGMVMFQC